MLGLDGIADNLFEAGEIGFRQTALVLDKLRATHIEVIVGNNLDQLRKVPRIPFANK